MPPDPVRRAARAGAPPVVVLIEDEPQIRRFLRATLGSQGYRLYEATTGEDGLVEAATRQPDVVILDLGLPDMDGLEVIRRLREWSTRADHRALGPRPGARQGRGPRRRRRRLREQAVRGGRAAGAPAGGAAPRRRPANRASRRSRWASLRVDQVKRQVQLDGKEVHLTPIEYRLLTTLVRHAGRVADPAAATKGGVGARPRPSRPTTSASTWGPCAASSSAIPPARGTC